MSATMATNNVASNERAFYYYLRDRYGAPLVTVCIYRHNERDFTRGIAICSDLDQPNKRKGRGIAFHRAKDAYRIWDQSSMIDKFSMKGMPMKRCATKNVINAVGFKHKRPSFMKIGGRKADIDVVLTKFEQELVTKTVARIEKTEGSG